jgi:hypothetical protein
MEITSLRISRPEDSFLKSTRGQFGKACSITINNAQKVSALFLLIENPR